MKSVVITGASSGIGEACAAFLDARGFRVFAGVRKEADAQRLQSTASDRLTPVVLDIVDSESIVHAGEVVREDVGEHGLDGLVNNAGISVTGPLEFVPMNDLRRQFEVNVFGHVAVTQQFLPLLRTARGRIVNMSSIGGRSAAPFLGPYSMSKFALEAYSDALRRELSPWGIDVSCVEPGSIATPIWQKGLDAGANAQAAAPPRARELYAQGMDAMRRYAERSSRDALPPEVVARVVYHALTAPKPRTRYLIGASARISATLTRLLPDRLMDAMFRKVLGIA
jgi:NAD(P)-dependent dehydrogenase (short-subunit alcohol dehydrogenase family)